MDISQGVTDNFIDQAKFVAHELGLEIEYREQDFYEITERFDVVLFLGVLYHLDDPIAGLRKVAELTAKTVVVESLSTPGRKPIMAFNPTGWDGDITSPWKPSQGAIIDLLTKAGLSQVQIVPRGNYRRCLIVASRPD